jgi:UDP-N-acetylglucosamine acyltransferase
VGRIDPTARVSEGSKIAADAEIGPFCLVGPDVELCGGVRLLSHVSVTGATTIGAGTVVYPFASLGTPPQSFSYRGTPTRLTVGSKCDIREGVTINTGTEDGGGITRIADHCFLMAGSHVGHDCQVGSNVVLANGTMLGGHVEVGDYAVFGGGVKVHQFVRVGEGAMISGGAGVAADVIPFGYVYGYRGHLSGLNIIGMKRRGFTRADIQRMRRAYLDLFSGRGVFRERLAAAVVEHAADPLIGRMIAFVQGGGGRPLMMAMDVTAGEVDAP